ncbi:myoD family inhibitor domain-containing protein 2 [Nelusetta ayraudi]|uniref:myoD family inhibitor domain-containing protein 2 n=1 Tax=Nelusetta ayraudi TaxID=303726 RepID=UPI003F6F601C
MEQMVDETAVRDKGRKHLAVAEEESSAWVRGVYPGKSLSTSSSMDSLSSSQQSCMGVDCAGMLLACLFCRFYEVIVTLPDSWDSDADAAAAAADDSGPGCDCGLLSSCQDASDCVELAMEMSEMCYR